MRLLGTVIGIVLVGVTVSSLDNALIFLMSGSVPGTGIALTPRATIAALIIFTMALFGFYTRHNLKRLFELGREYLMARKNRQSEPKLEPHLPKRRYQEL